MSKLIKNELFKIFHKKSIITILIIFIAYICLTNVIYRTASYDEEIGYDEHTLENVSVLNSSLEKYDLNNPGEVEAYIDILTTIENIEYYKKYEDNKWQREMVYTDLKSLQYQYNEAKYFFKDEELVNEYKGQIHDLLQQIENNDWRTPIEEELKAANKNLVELKQLITNTDSVSQKEQLEKDIAIIEISIEHLQYRLDNNIQHKDNYLSRALETNENAQKELMYYGDYDKLNEDEKDNYNLSNQSYKISQYILDTKQNINDYNNSHSILMNFYNEYSLLIVILILMISGSIVSEEFNKGTIKTLLIRPYSRLKIIASKYITSIIMLLLGILTIFVLQIIFGAIILDVESLALPAVIYNMTTQELEILSMAKHFLNCTLAILPMFLILSAVAFTLSTVFKNTALAIVTTIFGYLGTEIINSLAITFDIEIFKFFPTLHWDLTSYLYGGIPDYQFATLDLSITINIIFVAILTIIAFASFIKCNIKNI